jgi:hypothetical protein
MKEVKILDFETRKAQVQVKKVGVDQARENFRKALEVTEELRRFVANRPGQLFPEPGSAKT